MMATPSFLKTMRATTFVAVSLCLSSMANAQDISDSHLKAAKDAIAALKVTRAFDNILPTMAERLKVSIIQANPNFSDEISLTVDEQAIKLAPRRGDLENEAGLIYAKRFTEEELLAITEFYSSDLGKKILTEVPSASRELVRAAEIWNSGISRDLTAATNAALSESLSSGALNDSNQE